jgi:hypothetical protein
VGTGGCFVAGQEKEAAPSGVEVKNEWSYTFTPPYISMASSLTKHRDNLLLRYALLKQTPVFASPPHSSLELTPWNVVLLEKLIVAQPHPPKIFKELF